MKNNRKYRKQLKLQLLDCQYWKDLRSQRTPMRITIIDVLVRLFAKYQLFETRSWPAARYMIYCVDSWIHELPFDPKLGVYQMANEFQWEMIHLGYIPSHWWEQYCEVFPKRVNKKRSRRIIKLIARDGVLIPKGGALIYDGIQGQGRINRYPNSVLTDLLEKTGDEWTANTMTILRDVNMNQKSPLKLMPISPPPSGLTGDEPMTCDGELFTALREVQEGKRPMAPDLMLKMDPTAGQSGKSTLSYNRNPNAVLSKKDELALYVQACNLAGWRGTLDPDNLLNLYPPAVQLTDEEIEKCHTKLLERTDDDWGEYQVELLYRTMRNYDILKLSENSGYVRKPTPKGEYEKWLVSNPISQDDINFLKNRIGLHGKDET